MQEEAEELRLSVLGLKVAMSELLNAASSLFWGMVELVSAIPMLLLGMGILWVCVHIVWIFAVPFPGTAKQWEYSRLGVLFADFCLAMGFLLTF